MSVEFVRLIELAVGIGDIASLVTIVVEAAMGAGVEYADS